MSHAESAPQPQGGQGDAGEQGRFRVLGFRVLGFRSVGSFLGIPKNEDCKILRSPH